MSETADERNARFRREQMEDYAWWRDRTSFHPYSDLEKVLEDSAVILPEDGSYYIIANNLEEIKGFFYRIENVDRWKRSEVLKSDDDVWYDGESDHDFPIAIRAIAEPKTLTFNQFFEVDKRLQVRTEEEPHDVFEMEFTEEFLEDLTFPCLVQHSGDGGADRIGEYEINHCQVLNLTGCPLREGPVKIHVRWI